MLHKLLAAVLGLALVMSLVIAVTSPPASTSPRPQAVQQATAVPEPHPPRVSARAVAPR